MNLTIVTPPSGNVVTVEEFKDATHNDLTIDDVMLAGCLDSATAWCENYCRSTFLTTTYDLGYENIPSREVALFRNPVASVVSVKIKQNGTLVTVDPANYEVQVGNSGRIWLHSNALVNWYQCGFSNLVIRYTAGYGTAANVPQGIKSAIILQAKHLYYSKTVVDKKHDDQPWNIEWLLSPYCLGGYV